MSNFTAANTLQQRRVKATARCAVAERRLLEKKAAYEAGLAEVTQAEAELIAALAELADLKRAEAEEKDRERREALDKVLAEAAKAAADERRARVEAQEKRRGKRARVEEEDVVRPKRMKRGVCDRCKDRGLENSCKWPSGGGRRRCEPCGKTHYSCTLNGKSVSAIVGPQGDNSGGDLFQPGLLGQLQQMVKLTETRTALARENLETFTQIHNELRKLRGVHGNS